MSGFFYALRGRCLDSNRLLLFSGGGAGMLSVHFPVFDRGFLMMGKYCGARRFIRDSLTIYG
nr:MAG TPA: hypothetical protein [Caudoviricetes sp.]